MAFTDVSPDGGDALASLFRMDLEDRPKTNYTGPRYTSEGSLIDGERRPSHVVPEGGSLIGVNIDPIEELPSL